MIRHAAAGVAAVSSNSAGDKHADLKRNSARGGEVDWLLVGQVNRWTNLDTLVASDDRMM